MDEGRVGWADRAADMSLVVYRINWFRVLVDLNKAGLPDRRIAQEIGVNRSCISHYKVGRREPQHYNGEKLLVLHRKYCLSPEPPSREPILA